MPAVTIANWPSALRSSLAAVGKRRQVTSVVSHEWAIAILVRRDGQTLMHKLMTGVTDDVLRSSLAANNKCH
jgi:hypothetical protein